MAILVVDHQQQARTPSRIFFTIAKRFFRSADSCRLFLGPSHLVGKGLGRGVISNNFFEHIVHALQDRIVPETQHAKVL